MRFCEHYSTEQNVRRSIPQTRSRYASFAAFWSEHTWKEPAFTDVFEVLHSTAGDSTAIIVKRRYWYKRNFYILTRYGDDGQDDMALQQYLEWVTPAVITMMPPVGCQGHADSAARRSTELCLWLVEWQQRNGAYFLLETSDTGAPCTLR